MVIDAFDKKILALLQADATLSTTEIAEQVGLSTTPCWRRIQRLQEAGVVRGRVAILDRTQLNVGVTVFIAVRTNQHSPEWLERFHSAVTDLPEIVDFYRMSGDIDYLLRAVVPDIQSYDLLYKRLISRIEIADVTSMFAMEEIKSTTRMPLDYC